MRMKNHIELINLKNQNEISNIESCNKITSVYGLSLNVKQISNLLEKKQEILKSTGRIEFRESIIKKIIIEFSDSTYITQESYESILHELIEIFYEYKNETMDIVTDDELIKFMKKSFDGICKGDIDYLSGTIMYEMKKEVLNGKKIDDVRVGDDFEQY